MPTASDRSRTEAAFWKDVAVSWTPEAAGDLYDDLPPSERDVIGHHDPGPDLDARAETWGHRFDRHHLDRLAAAAAGLALSESRAWADDHPDVALRSYEARRFLIGDRVVHWAVPWLDAVGQDYPAHRDRAIQDRDALLDLGDEMRIAPSLRPGEGTVLDGEDSYGRRAAEGPLAARLASLWSGTVVLRPTLRSWRGDAGLPDRTIDPAWLADARFAHEVAAGYRDAADRWTGLAEAHPGTAALWGDLAARAAATLGQLGSSPGRG